MPPASTPAGLRSTPGPCGPVPGATWPHSAFAFHRDDAILSKSPRTGGSSSSFQTATLSSGLDNGLEDATGCGRHIVSLSFAMCTFSFLRKEKGPFSPESGTFFSSTQSLSNLEVCGSYRNNSASSLCPSGDKACFFRGQ